MIAPIDVLREEYARGNLCLFVGAGVSAGCGLPAWQKLAEEVLGRIPREPYGNLPVEMVGRARPLTGEIDPNWYFRYMKDILGPIDPMQSMRYIRANKELDIAKLVRQCLYAREIHLTDVALELPLLAKARRICCFNYDDILSRAFAEAGESFTCLFPGDVIPLESSERLIFYPHGYLPDPEGAESSRATENVVLSEEDYFELYNSPYAWANLVQIILLMNYTALFIGCSLADPNLRRLLHISSSRRPGHRHFAIMRNHHRAPSGAWWMAQQALAYEKLHGPLYKDLGVEIMWISDFPEIASFLKNIRK